MKKIVLEKINKIFENGQSSGNKLKNDFMLGTSKWEWYIIKIFGLKMDPKHFTRPCSVK